MSGIPGFSPAWPRHKKKECDAEHGPEPGRLEGDGAKSLLHAERWASQPLS